MTDMVMKLHTVSVLCHYNKHLLLLIEDSINALVELDQIGIVTNFAARNIERIPRISPNDIDDMDAVVKIDMEERLHVMENNLGETRAELMMYGDGLKTVQNTVLSHEASIMNCVAPNERMQVPYMSHQSMAVFESAVSDVAAAGDSGNFACAQWPSLAVPYVAPCHDSVTIIQTAPSSVNGTWAQSDGVNRVKSAPTHGVANAATFRLAASLSEAAEERTAM